MMASSTFVVDVENSSDEDGCDLPVEPMTPYPQGTVSVYVLEKICFRDSGLVESPRFGCVGDEEGMI
jgi:hypothetical protein